MTPIISSVLNNGQVSLLNNIVLGMLEMLTAFDQAGLDNDAVAARQLRNDLMSLRNTITQPLIVMTSPAPVPPSIDWRMDPTDARRHGCTSLEWMLSCHAAEKRHPTNPYPQSKDIELGKDAARHILPAYLTTNEEQKA